MGFTLHVRPVVTRETSAVYDHHEDRKPGLGDRFMIALRECYRSIEANPYGYQIRKSTYRHAMVPGFRYRVVFEVEGREIHVYQLRHTSRKQSKKYGP